MINLTPDDIKFSFKSPDGVDQLVTINKSGHIARVERQEHDSDPDINRATTDPIIPIIEETPREIVISTPDDTRVPLGRHAFEDQGLLVVSREVAEAASTLKHPLASRMVWIARPTPEHVYTALQRMPLGLQRRRGFSH